MAKAKKEKKQPEPYWQELVNVYFEFTKQKFHDVPSFDGSAPRDLKNILQALRKRAEDKQVEWTYEVATTRFRHFLEWAVADKFLSENWLLSMINRRKDIIFYKIAQK